MVGARTMAIYDIRIRETLDDHWAAWFDPLSLARVPDGQTALHGDLPDQAALYGILNRIAHLGLTLLSVSSLPEGAARIDEQLSPSLSLGESPRLP